MKSVFIKHKKAILFILGYFVIGYIVVLSIYFLSNPGYFKPCPPTVAQFKCSAPADLVIRLAGRSNFWFEVAVWPLTVINYLID